MFPDTPQDPILSIQGRSAEVRVQGRQLNPRQPVYTHAGLQDTERNPSHNAPKAALQPTEGESYAIWFLGITDFFLSSSPRFGFRVIQGCRGFRVSWFR